MKENLEKIAPLSPVKGMAGLSKYLEMNTKTNEFCGSFSNNLDELI